MAKHAHIPGMVNPYKFGLLGGLSGFLQGYQQNLDMQRKYAAMSSIEEMKARNNRLLKMLEMEGNQRAYTVHQVGDDGKVYDVAMRNTLNPQSGQWEPKEIGRAPTKDPLAATNALISSREKIAKQQIDAANARNAARLAAKNDPSVETAAERRNRVAQDSMNNRAAAAATERDMRTWNKDMDASQKAAALQSIGSNIDPKKDPAGAARAYHDAMLQQHKADLGASGGASATPPQPGESSSHPDMTPNGQPIKYDAQGNAYIKGPDGTPVPYDPTADASQSGLALDSADAQELAQSGAPSGESDQPQEEDGQGLLASTERGSENEDEEPEDEDTESESDYQRGLYPPGYAPKGPLLNGYPGTDEQDE